MRREVTFRGSTCFGCGADNPKGLRLRFFETDEGVEVDYVSPPHLDGAPGIIHGGIQGTLLDEAMCMAVYAKRGRWNDNGQNTMDTAIYLMPNNLELGVYINSGPGSGVNQASYNDGIQQQIINSAVAS